MENELFKQAILAFGNTRGYWCKHCGGHVIDGHKESCKLVKAAINEFGKKWVEKHIQVEEWDNHSFIAYRSKVNTNLK